MTECRGARAGRAWEGGLLGSCGRPWFEEAAMQSTDQGPIAREGASVPSETTQEGWRPEMGRHTQGRWVLTPFSSRRAPTGPEAGRTYSRRRNWKGFQKDLVSGGKGYVKMCCWNSSYRGAASPAEQSLPAASCPECPVHLGRSLIYCKPITW